MATHCCGRRLSDLLQEQQEPFLVKRQRPSSVAEACSWRRRGVSVSNVEGARVVRKTLLWDLAACFSCGARDRFRRLPRSGDIGGNGEQEDRSSGRQLSPVSVLQLRFDEEESTQLSHWDEEEDSKPSSTSPSSESDHHPRAGAAFTFYDRSTSNGGTVPAMEGEDIESKFQTTTKGEEQTLVSAWERIAADISRIPRLVELDLSVSAREWRRRIGEEEARRVGESIEAMIFEEVSWEAVRALKKVPTRCHVN